MMTRKIFRVRLQRLFRRTRLLSTVEKMRYVVKSWELRNRNRRFIQANPDFALPPAHLAFDAYSSSHWEFYKLSGEVSARFLAGILEKYFPLTLPPRAVYEWGCGPARISRQLRAYLTRNAEFYASDFNAETINWCQRNIRGVQFFKNNLFPPVSCRDNKFDFIFAISVFTHLSESNCLEWAEELHRLLCPGGILLITTDSDYVCERELLRDERKLYDTTGIVVRGDYQEGKKMYLTRHSPQYVREKLLRQFEILEHVSAGFPFMKQDYWIARKRY